MNIKSGSGQVAEDQTYGEGVGDQRSNNAVQSSERSQIIQQLFIEDLPIYSCNWICAGKEAIFTGNRKHFYSYDLESNRLVKQGAVLGHKDERNLSNLVTV